MYDKKWMADFERALEWAGQLVKDSYSSSKLNELAEWCAERDIAMYMDYVDDDGNDVFYVEDERFTFTI